MSTFWVVLYDFVFWKKIFFLTEGQFWAESFKGQKFVVFFFDDLRSPNAKFECSSGFWFLIFLPPWDWPPAVKVSSVTQAQKKKFNINYFGVVLTMLPVFFLQKKFLGPRPGRLEQKNFFFSKTVKNTFWTPFGWFYMILCSGKKNFFLFTWGQL